MRIYDVERHGAYRGGPLDAPTPAPLTPIEPVRTEETFVAPVSDPGGRTQRQVWHTHSVDGRWCYRRNEGEGSPWTVTFVPTGQRRDWYSTLKAARQATAAAALLADLRHEAVLSAWPNAPRRADERCADGQRILAVHMRLAGSTEVEAGCGSCGGLLVVAMRSGRWGHVDACARCRDAISADVTCPAAAEHRFCGTPTPDTGPGELTSHDRRVLEFETLWWKQPGAKEHAIRTEFGGITPTRYYADLNRIIRKPAAVREFPLVVRRLLRIIGRDERR